MQTNIENGVTVFHADPGMKLTDGYEFVNVVRLGKEADGAEWYEITEEEAKARMEVVITDDEVIIDDCQTDLSEVG